MSHGAFTLDEIVTLTRGTAQGASRMERRPRRYRLDSREVEAGDLFVAVKGERADGADFIGQVAGKGAFAALTERAVALPGGDLVQVEVPCVREALQTLAAEHRRRIDIPVVAITGSSGKTTTKDVISRVLSRVRRTASSAGNFNSQLGLPLCLLNDLTKDHEVAVYEVGMSARGEIARLAGMIQPSIGAVTNVGPAHLEFLGSLDGVYEAKSELIDALPPGGLVVLNAEDDYGMRMRRRFAGRAVMVTQADPTAAFAPASPERTQRMRLEVTHSGLEGTRGRLWIGDEDHAFHLPLLGRHLAYAGMMAVAIGRELGIPVQDLLEGLVECRPTTHRMEVRQGRVKVLDDCYNANPSSTKAALAFLEEVDHPGRKIAVLGDMLEMGETGPEAHREIVARVRDSRLSKVHLVGPLYAEAAESVGVAADPRFATHATTDALAAVLPASLEPTDLILLKGSRGIKLDKLLPLL